MRRIAIAFALAGLAVVGPCVAASPDPGDLTDIQALRRQVADNDDKRKLVEAVLNLTPAEEKRFWKIYDAYQRDLDEAGRMQALALEVLVARDRPLTDKYAVQLARDLTLADKTEFDGRQKMQRGVMKALPPKKAARYIQLEQKVRAMTLYDIAVTFPLVK